MIGYDPTLCVHCGACSVHCPHGTITFDTKDLMVFSHERCLHCGACLDACPCSALSEVNSYV